MASLPSIKLKETTLDNLKSAVAKYNRTSLVKMSVQEFRRLSYEFLSQMILQDKELDLELLPE